MSFVLGYETIRVLLYNNYNNWVHYTHDTVQTLQHAHTHPYEHTYTNQTEHPTNLEIPEVTISISLVTGTPLTTRCTSLPNEPSYKPIRWT
jgi:hypothetical protein